jgi:hypothetical protein
VSGGDAGMTAYLASNPQITDVDGYVDKDRLGKLDTGNLLSPMQLYAPGILFDELYGSFNRSVITTVITVVASMGNCGVKTFLIAGTHYSV